MWHDGLRVLDDLSLCKLTKRLEILVLVNVLDELKLGQGDMLFTPAEVLTLLVTVRVFSFKFEPSLFEKERVVLVLVLVQIVWIATSKRSEPRFVSILAPEGLLPELFREPSIVGAWVWRKTPKVCDVLEAG